MITWEAVAAVGGIGVALLAALGCIWGKLSAIGEKVDGLAKKYAENRDEDRADHVRVWAKLDDHESRIIGLEARE